MVSPAFRAPFLLFFFLPLGFSETPLVKYCIFNRTLCFTFFRVYEFTNCVKGFSFFWLNKVKK